MKNNFKPAIRFEGFTEKWKLRKISDVVDKLYNGQTPSRAQKKFWNGEINWLTSGELNRSVVTKTIEKITTSGQESANLRIVPKGTFVMAITGLEAVGTRGNCAILGIETTLNQSCMAIFPKSDLLNTEFLFQWYKMVGENYGIQFTQGTKQQSYNAEIIKKLDICLPIVEEQTKIGDLFRQLEELISIHQQELDTLKQTKKGFLQKMFPKEGKLVPELRFPGFDTEWELRSLGEVAPLRGGFAFQSKKFKKNGVPIVRISNIQSNGEVGGDYAYYEEQPKDEKFLLKDGAALLAMSGATTGKVAILKNSNKEKVYQNQRVGFFTVTKKVNYDFISIIVRSPMFTNQLKSVLVSGAQPNVSSKEIDSFEFLFPKTKEEQIQIGTFFKQFDEVIALQQQELDALKQTKKAFLQKMFV